MTNAIDRWESETANDALSTMPMADMQAMNRVEWELNNAVWHSEHELLWIALNDEEVR